MKRALATLLVSLGVVVAGLELARVERGVTMAELRDAGFQQCPPVDLACEVRVSTDAGYRYARPVFDARDCSAFDAGLVLTDRRLYQGGEWDPPASLEFVDRARCKVLADAGVPDDGGAGLREMAQECGCRKASGVCRYQLPDGGTAPAPFGRTLGPGYPPFETFGGAGCAPKACTALAAHDAQRRPVDETWPADCPGG